MSSSSTRPPGSGASAPPPDAARNELDSLRSALDTRLAALEAALANPDQHESLEALILDLARVATAEADSAATVASLVAQVQAQEQTAASAAELEKALAADRATIEALQLDLKQLRLTLETERSSSAQLRREFDQSKSALEEERKAAAGYSHELDKARESAAKDREVVEALTRGVAESQKAAEHEHAARTQLAAELADAQRRLNTGEHDLAAAHQAADARLAEGADTARRQIHLLERRVADLDREKNDIAARADALEHEYRSAADMVGTLKRERDGSAHILRERDDLAGRKDALARERDGLAQERDGLLRERDAISGERDVLAAELDAEHQRTGSRMEALDKARLDAERHWQDAEARVAAAVRDIQTASVERSAAIAELDAVRKTAGKTEEDTRAYYEEALRAAEEALKAAEQRIYTLELKSFEADRERSERDIELNALMNAAAAPDAPIKPPRSGKITRPSLLVQVESELADSADAAASGAKGTPRESTAAPAARPIIPPGAPVRKAVRHPFKSARAIHLDAVSAIIVDLSATGVQVIAPTSLKPNQMMKIMMPCDQTPVSCKGKIVWVRIEPPSGGQPLRYRAGVAFTAVDDHALEMFLIRYASA